MVCVWGGVGGVYQLSLKKNKKLNLCPRTSSREDQTETSWIIQSSFFNPAIKKKNLPTHRPGQYLFSLGWFPFWLVCLQWLVLLLHHSQCEDMKTRKHVSFLDSVDTFLYC